jgi:hypothetical protein
MRINAAIDACLSAKLRCFRGHPGTILPPDFFAIPLADAPGATSAKAHSPFRFVYITPTLTVDETAVVDAIL